jgi:hypothetical protein
MGNPSTTVLDAQAALPALALIRTSVGTKGYFGTGFFVSRSGVMLTALHNLTTNGEPNGPLLARLLVYVYDDKRTDWVELHEVSTKEAILDIDLDVAVIVVPNVHVARPFRLGAHWSIGDEVSVPGMQEYTRRGSGFDAHWLVCQVPRPPLLHRLHIQGGPEPSMRLVILDNQLAPGKGISGAPVLKLDHHGLFAIAVQKAVKKGRDLRGPEVHVVPVDWLRDRLDRLPPPHEIVWVSSEIAELIEIQKGVLTASSLEDLQRELARVKDYLQTFPHSSEAQRLDQQIQKAISLAIQDRDLVRTQRVSPSRGRAERWRGSSWLTMSLPPAIILLLVASGAALSLWGAGKSPGTRAAVFPLEGHYQASGKIGDINDIEILPQSPGLIRFTYTPTGRPPHEWDWKYLNDGSLNPAPAAFGGALYLSPTNSFGMVKDSGYDLRGHWWNWTSTFKRLAWEARVISPEVTAGRDGAANQTVRVEFVLGGVNWAWVQRDGKGEKGTVPYPDTMPQMSLGTRELSTQWQAYDDKGRLLEEPDESFKRVVGGFGWTIRPKSTGLNSGKVGVDSLEPETYVIEIRNVRYER